jgi:HEAT repeat protein
LLGDKGLARNPFWLSLMVEQNIFEAEYVEILDRSINDLLRREWDKQKSSNRWLKRFPPDQQILETRMALAAYAYELVVAEKNDLEFSEACYFIDNFAQTHKIKDLTGSNVIGFAQDSHLLEIHRMTGGKNYPARFRHPLLKDFLAACFTLSESIFETQPELLAQNIKRWRYVVFFAVNLLNTNSPWTSHKRHKRFVELVINNNNDISTILAIACSLSVVEKHLGKELYNAILIRIEQEFNMGFSNELKNAINHVINFSVENAIETLDDLYERGFIEQFESILFYLVELSIESGHKSRLLIQLFEKYKLDKLVITSLKKVGIRAKTPLLEVLDSENEYSKFDNQEPSEHFSASDIQELKLSVENHRKLTALSALVKIDPIAAQPYLKKFLLESEPSRKTEIIGLIGETGNPDLIPVLLKQYDAKNHPYDFLIMSAINMALSKMGKAGLEALLDLVPKRTSFADIMLINLDDAIAIFGFTATDGLRKLLKNRHQDAVYNALWIAKKVKDPSLLPDLLLLLKPERLSIAREVVDAMVECGESAIPYLIDGLNSTGWGGRFINSYIVDGLVKIGKSSVPNLISMLDRSENIVVASVAEALGKIKDYHAIPYLKNLLLTHENTEVITKAGIALGQMRSDRAKKILLNVIDDNKTRWNRLTAALIGLVALGDRKMQGIALEIVANGGLYEQNKELDNTSRLNLSSGFMQIRDADALPAMSKFKNDLLSEDTEKSKEYAEIVDKLIETLENIFHPKSDPRLEELEKQSKEREEQYQKIMGNN